MSLVKPKNIEENLLFLLKKGPQKCLDLVTKIKEIRPQTTKQAVYCALRILRDQENIIITKGAASLNLSWLNEMTNFFEGAKGNYVKNSNDGSFLRLEDKERIKYYFQTVEKADIFWTHAIYILIEQLKEKEPIFFYNPHEWFLLARNKNEQAFIDSFAHKNHPFLLTAGGSTPLDKHIASGFDGTKSQYNMLTRPMFKENNYYLNIFGDFLIEVWLDKEISNEVDALYQTATDFDDDAKEKIQKILARQGRTRLVISHNHKKATRLKKILAKDFAINQKNL